MFKQLQNLSVQRTIKNALGFYIAYCVLGIILGLIAGSISTFFELETGAQQYRSGILLGVSYISLLAVTVYLKKKLPLLNLFFVALALPLSFFGGVILGMLPIAYLTTKANENESTFANWFSRTFDFKGRANRRECFVYIIAISVTSAILGAILESIGESSALLLTSIGLLSLAIYIFLLLKYLAVVVRRLHDIGISGKFIFLVPVAWLLAINLSISASGTGWEDLMLVITYITLLLPGLVLFLLSGSKGANTYGDCPSTKNVVK